MRGGMAEDVQRIGIFFGENLQLYVAIQRVAQIDQLAFFFCAAFHNKIRLAGEGTILGKHPRHERGAAQPRRNAIRDIQRRGPLGDVLDAAVG
jgi:hypothetical protein